jgi:preprotein translocase subunit SecA
MQDNKRDMHKIDEALYFVEEKKIRLNWQITELNTFCDTDSDFCPSRHWNWNCSYRKEKLDKDAEAEEKRTIISRFKKASVFTHDTTFKAYALFEKM